MEFRGIKPWPVKLLSPGAMGWYAFVPFMQCYHGILSLNHSINGNLEINSQLIDFSGGRGYTEKDWGSSLPAAYVWVQSNHFRDPSISLTASIAKIPWLGNYFRGFLIGIYINNQFIRFTTYNGSKLEGFSVTGSEINFAVENKQYKLFVNVLRKDAGLLIAPSEEAMDIEVSESLNSIIHMELKDKSRGQIFAGGGKLAGVDVHGSLEEIAEIG